MVCVWTTQPPSLPISTTLDRNKHLSSQSLKLRPFSSVNPLTNQRICFNFNFIPANASTNPSSSVDEVHIEDRASTLRQICHGHVPEHVLNRMEELGYVIPTDIQREALPALFTGRDCILHAQTGSGKTLTYLLLAFSVVNTQRAAVQAVIVVPTRELGMQVTNIARKLAAKPMELGLEQKSCTVMALLDGGMLKRHKSWLKAEPPTMVVATIGSLCNMLEKHIFELVSTRIMVIDEVDFMFNSSSQVSSLRKLLTSYSSSNNRQTVFASASIPQHKRFVYDCIQQKWTKNDVVHVHVNAVEPMPSCLYHRFVVCAKNRRFQTLLLLLQSDAPESGIIFVNEQSEKSKKTGNAPSTTLVIDLLKTEYEASLDIFLLEEGMNFNSRADSLSTQMEKIWANPGSMLVAGAWDSRAWRRVAVYLAETSELQRHLDGAGTIGWRVLVVDGYIWPKEVRQGGAYLLVATDIAARGMDLPETTHIYNFDLPKTAVDYLHRAGRTGRKPFSNKKCSVSNLIASEERFVLQRYENELKFNCEEVNV